MILLNNIPEYSVTEFNDTFSEIVATAFSLVKIRGEISNLKNHYSGHSYFTLKDDKSIINVVCWKANLLKLKIVPEEGIEVIATGKITTYAKSISVYQLNIEDLEIAGEGALLKLIEDRKKRLQAKGYFDQNRKKRIPFIPDSIGIITSPTGSVIRDIIHRITERFPVTLQVWPTPVQGKKTVNKIVEAIKGFNSSEFSNPPDVIIIARGGGSIEDLMPFNDEQMARAVFDSKIPIISAIGHETDNTIIDLVSDLRVPTPTAAAEKSVPVRIDLKNILASDLTNLNAVTEKIFLFNSERFDKLNKLLQQPLSIVIFFRNKLDNLTYKHTNIMENKLINLKNILSRLVASINLPKENIKNNKHILHRYKKELHSSSKQIYKNNINRLCNLSKLLSSSSIEKTLKRGYAIVKKNKKIISRTVHLNNQDMVKIQFFDDQLQAKIKKT